mmetsp:Transcript_19641/g.69541  ORF Transcript_19641/g.69541 Transcript_19641/m.69541 type:complete len:380 (-) Transcript_19641:21-1160(-)
MSADRGSKAGAAHGGAGGRSESSAAERVTALRLKGKVVVVGEIAVGKTSIVGRFTTGVFDKASRPSIGVAFSQKAVVVDHHSVRFELWDTAGQERFRSVNTLYYRGAAAGVVIYDVTNRKSFDTLQSHWVQQLRASNAGNFAKIAKVLRLYLKNVAARVRDPAGASCKPNQTRRFATRHPKVVKECGAPLCNIPAAHGLLLALGFRVVKHEGEEVYELPAPPAGDPITAERVAGRLDAAREALNDAAAAMPPTPSLGSTLSTASAASDASTAAVASSASLPSPRAAATASAAASAPVSAAGARLRPIVLAWARRAHDHFVPLVPVSGPLAFPVFACLPPTPPALADPFCDPAAIKQLVCLDERAPEWSWRGGGGAAGRR